MNTNSTNRNTQDADMNKPCERRNDEGAPHTGAPLYGHAEADALESRKRSVLFALTTEELFRQLSAQMDVICSYQVEPRTQVKLGIAAALCEHGARLASNEVKRFWDERRGEPADPVDLHDVPF